MTQTQVKAKVILPEMVCRNCKRFYFALQDGRGRCQVKRGEVVSRNEMCDRFSPAKVEVEK
jgi:hypothetical protein